MRSKIWCPLTAVVALFAGPTPTVSAQDAPPKRPDPKEIAKLKEQMRPGPEHEELAKYIGYWKVTATMGDGRRSASSEGKGRSYMMMDGRFLWISYGTKGRAGPLKGGFIVGFDRRHGHYTIIALDTFGTYSVTSKGKREDDGKIRMHGKDDDPHMKALGFDKEFVHVLDLRKPDEFAIEVHYVDTRTPERKTEKAMEFVFGREAKADAP